MIEAWCKACTEYSACPIKRLNFKDQITPALVGRFLDRQGILGGEMTRQIASKGNPTRRIDVSLLGERNPESPNHIQIPTKAILECSPLESPSLWGSIVNAFRRNKDVNKQSRKTTWRNEQEARDDFYGSLNNLITLSFHNHFINLDSGVVEPFNLDVLYIESAYAARVQPMLRETNPTKILQLAGKAFGTAIIGPYSKSLVELIIQEKPWMDDKFIAGNIQTALDCTREGYQQATTDAPKNSSLNLIQLIAGGAANAARVLGATDTLKTKYPWINPLKVGKTMALVKFDHLQMLTDILLEGVLDVASAAIPEIPILSEETGGIKISNLNKYRQGAAECPAGHRRTDSSHELIQRTLSSYSIESFPLTHEFAGRRTDSITAFARLIHTNRAAFFEAWKKRDPLIESALKGII